MKYNILADHPPSSKTLGRNRAVSSGRISEPNRTTDRGLISDWYLNYLPSFQRFLSTQYRFKSERPAAQANYKDRISIVAWLIVFGLGLSLLFDMPTQTVEFSAFGTPTSVPVTDTVVATLFLAILAAAGTESVICTHPRLMASKRSIKNTSVYWALPMALTIIFSLSLPVAPSRFIQVLAMLFSGGLVTLSLFCLYATVVRGQTGFRRARFILNTLAYGSALLLFLFVYETRTRSLLSGTFIAITATLLAVEILRSTIDDVNLAFMYGAIVGLVLGQATWALNYWLVSGLTGGLLLLLLFYLLVGIAQQGLQDRLNQRVVMEFAIFAAIALILIAIVGSAFG